MSEKNLSAVNQSFEQGGMMVIEQMRNMFFNKWNKKLENLQMNVRQILDYKVDELGYETRQEDTEKELEEMKKFRDSILEKLKRLGLASVQKDQYEESQE